MRPAITESEIVPLLKDASPTWQPDPEEPTCLQLGSYGRFILNEV